MLIAITGKIAVGKSTTLKNIKDEFNKIDLDSVAKAIFYKAEIQNFVAKYCKFDENLTQSIWKNIMADDERYVEYCSLFEDDLIEFVRRYRHEVTPVLFEASALSSYPRLIKEFDLIIEITCDDDERMRYLKYRNLFLDDPLNRAEISDRRFKSLTPHIYHINSDKSFYEYLCECIKQLKVGLFCGSFNPLTIGHLNIYKKAQHFFDIVYLVRAQNPDKAQFSWPIPEGHNLRWLTTTYIPDVIKSMCVDPILVRGVRNAQDCDEALSWQKAIGLCMSKKVDLLLIPCDPEYTSISSSFVRGVHELNQDDAKKFIVHSKE